MNPRTTPQRTVSGVLLAAALLVCTLSGCTFTQKTTVENKDGQEVRRTSYGFDFHVLSTEESEED